MTTLFRDIQGVWFIATLSVCLGLLLNQLHNQPLPLAYQSKIERLRQAVAHLSGDDLPQNLTLAGKELSLSEFQKFVKNKQGLILDARPEIFHRLNHVPGARSLPRDDFENAYNHLKETLEKDKNQPLVVYCSGASCEDSEMVQQALVKLNFTNVAVFRGGWSEWTQAGLPEEKTP